MTRAAWEPGWRRRWNLPGTGIIYTSETRDLAMLEFLVYLSWPHFPPDIHVATLRSRNKI